MRHAHVSILLLLFLFFFWANWCRLLNLYLCASCDLFLRKMLKTTISNNTSKWNDIICLLLSYLNGISCHLLIQKIIKWISVKKQQQVFAYKKSRTIESLSIRLGRNFSKSNGSNSEPFKFPAIHIMFGENMFTAHVCPSLNVCKRKHKHTNTRTHPREHAPIQHTMTIDNVCELDKFVNVSMIRQFRQFVKVNTEIK